MHLPRLSTIRRKLARLHLPTRHGLRGEIDIGRTAISIGIAFGLVFFLVLVGIGAGSMLSSNTNATYVDSALQAGSSFLSNFGGTLGIGLLIAIVLGGLGVGKIIDRVFS